MSELFNNYEILNNPYNFYSFLRKESPISFNEDGTVALSRHSDISTVLSSPYALKNIEDFTTQPNQTVQKLKKIRQEYFYGVKTFFDIDGEDHENMRNSVIKYFTKSHTIQYKEFIEKQLTKTLNKFQYGDEIDIYKEVFYKIPLDVISYIIGIPESLRIELAENVSRVTRLFEPNIGDLLAEDIGQSAQKISTFLVDIVSYKKNHLENDLLSDLINVENDISKILAMITPLYVAGHITTSYLLSTSLKSLIDNPEQKHLFISNPENSKYLEEMIRYDTPAHIIQRTLSKDLEINNDIMISEGTLIYLFLASANRDELLFDDPDRFYLQRNNSNRNISFAAGAHYCIGSSLAKMEIDLILPKILQIFPNIENKSFDVCSDVAVKQLKNYIVTL